VEFGKTEACLARLDISLATPVKSIEIWRNQSSQCPIHTTPNSQRQALKWATLKLCQDGAQTD
jgi:hypothetical protein